MVRWAVGELLLHCNHHVWSSARTALCCAFFSRKDRAREGRICRAVRYLMRNLSEAAIKTPRHQMNAACMHIKILVKSLRRAYLSGAESEECLCEPQEGNSSTGGWDQHIQWVANIFLVGLNMNLSRFCVLPKGMQTPSFMGVDSVRIFVICYLKATTQSRFSSLLFMYSGGFCVLKWRAILSLYWVIKRLE